MGSDPPNLNCHKTAKKNWGSHTRYFGNAPIGGLRPLVSGTRWIPRLLNDSIITCAPLRYHGLMVKLHTCNMVIGVRFPVVALSKSKLKIGVIVNQSLGLTWSVRITNDP